MRFHIVLGLFLTYCVHNSIAQVLDYSQSGLSTQIKGVALDEWKYNEGDNPDWAQKDFDDSGWQKIKISEPLKTSGVDFHNRFWLRTAVNTDSLNEDSLVALLITQFGASEIYINGQLIKSLGNIASEYGYESYNPHNNPIPVMLERGYHVIAIRFQADLPSSEWVRSRSDVPLISVKLQQLENALSNREALLKFSLFPVGFGFISGVLCFLFLMLYLFFPKQLLYLFYGLFNLFLVVSVFIQAYLDAGQYELAERAYLISGSILVSRLIGMNILLFMLYALNRIRPLFWMYVGFMILIDFPLTILLPVEYLFISSAFRSIIIVISFWLAYHAFTSRDKLDWLIGVIACSVILVNISAALQQFTTIDITMYTMRLVAPILTTIAIAIYLALRYSRINKSLEHQLIQVKQLSEENLVKEIEKQEILAAQAVELERQVDERTAQLQEQKNALQTTLDELKSTQAQLIQSEKLASLGQLTAGIAHEIQNPLNFVNNFSEVSAELVDEIEEERAKSQESRDETLVSEILGDIKENLGKINHHGKRADAIVKGMLEHSMGGSGEKELTNLNSLAKEYSNLAYQGFKAKNKGVEIDLITDFDSSLPKIKIVRSEIGKVLVNILNNAFYAVTSSRHGQAFEIHSTSADTQSSFDIQKSPKVTITTKLREGSPLGAGGSERKLVEISITDNGPGIPNSIKDKIFQPFFTTKPTGQGTGLGLSLAYDIMKAHGGEISAVSKNGKGTTFNILLSI